MSPIAPTPGGKFSAPDNLYTVVLALALLIVLATTALVTYLCYMRYETIFKIAS